MLHKLRHVQTFLFIYIIAVLCKLCETRETLLDFDERIGFLRIKEN